MPVVTVLTPAYNHEKYISQCIESVLNQSYGDWEMLILDDGSTDQTRSLAEDFAGKDNRIRVLTREHKGIFGLADLYNQGLSGANGTLIAILEGDDVWLPDKLQIQVAAMESNPQIILASGQAILMDQSERDIRVSPHVREEYRHLLSNHPAGSIIELSLYRVWILSLTCIVRKDALIKIGGFRYVQGMPMVDFPTWLALSLIGPFHFTERVLAKWRVYPEQSSKVYHVEMHESVYREVLQHLDLLDGMKSDIRAQIRRHFYRECLSAMVRSGRFRLMRSEFKDARKDFIRALIHPAPGMVRYRLRALAGIIAAFLHLATQDARIGE